METVSDVNMPSSPATITLSSSAAAKVASLLSEEGVPGMALRISVRSGGCSGFAYEMYFDADTAPDDERIVTGDVAVVVDAVSRPLLAGSTLDYTDALNESGFKVVNPNATRSCGCGKSFGA
jgi:iron-sulfur cluster assembly protein/iron-sulfur cluster insertion protein